jgi:hypothetical protein
MLRNHALNKMESLVAARGLNMDLSDNLIETAEEKKLIEDDLEPEIEDMLQDLENESKSRASRRGNQESAGGGFFLTQAEEEEVRSQPVDGIWAQYWRKHEKKQRRVDEAASGRRISLSPRSITRQSSFARRGSFGSVPSRRSSIASTTSIGSNVSILSSVAGSGRESIGSARDGQDSEIEIFPPRPVSAVSRAGKGGVAKKRAITKKKKKKIVGTGKRRVHISGQKQKKKVVRLNTSKTRAAKHKQGTGASAMRHVPIYDMSGGINGAGLSSATKRAAIGASSARRATKRKVARSTQHVRREKEDEVSKAKWQKQKRFDGAGRRARYTSRVQPRP